MVGRRPVRGRSPADHYRHPPFQGWQGPAADLCLQVCGDKAANERRLEMAQEHRNDDRSAKPQSQVELIEDELEQVSAAGGRVDPGGANN
jgi:hypothetical protein